MPGAILLLAVILDGSTPRECASPPSSASSDAYWTYIDACGCGALYAPSRASHDYERFMKACAAWRERNPRVNVTVIGGTTTSSSTTSSTTTTVTTSSKPAECGSAPSRASNSFWTYIESCGCADADPPPATSSDYERFLKACGAWRERNPEVNVVVQESERSSSEETPQRKPER